MKKKDFTEKEIEENIRWFTKFSLEERFRIAKEHQKAIEILRTLRESLKRKWISQRKSNL